MESWHFWHIPEIHLRKLAVKSFYFAATDYTDMLIHLSDSVREKQIHRSLFDAGCVGNREFMAHRLTILKKVKGTFLSDG